MTDGPALRNRLFCTFRHAFLAPRLPGKLIPSASMAEAHGIGGFTCRTGTKGQENRFLAICLPLHESQRICSVGMVPTAFKRAEIMSRVTLQRQAKSPLANKDGTHGSGRLSRARPNDAGQGIGLFVSHAHQCAIPQTGKTPSHEDAAPSFQMESAMTSSRQLEEYFHAFGAR